MVRGSSLSRASISASIRSRTGSGDWERDAGGCEMGEEVEWMETGEEEVPLRLGWVRGGGTLWAWTRARSSCVRVCTGIEIGRERGALCDGGRISVAIVVVAVAVVFAKHRQQVHTRPYILSTARTHPSHWLTTSIANQYSCKQAKEIAA